MVFLAILGAQRDRAEALRRTRPSCAGRASPGELEGPEELHLILMDNGRVRQVGGPAARGALLPALRRLPQRLPGVPADRRPRLRPYLSRAHRYPAHRHAQGRPLGEGAGARVHRSAAPARTSARCASTSRACWWSCASSSTGSRIAPWSERMVFRARPPRHAVARAVPARRAGGPAAPAALSARRQAPPAAALLREVDGHAGSSAGGGQDLLRALEASSRTP